MRITKRQLRRIIKEEKARLLNEAMPGVDRQVQDLWGPGDGGQDRPEPDIERDMRELLSHLREAESMAADIEAAMGDLEYGEWAGGREANDLELALSKIWQAFGGQSLRAEGFDE
jgi:hypothetical protein